MIRYIVRTVVKQYVADVPSLLGFLSLSDVRVGFVLLFVTWLAILNYSVSWPGVVLLFLFLSILRLAEAEARLAGYGSAVNAQQKLYK